MLQPLVAIVIFLLMLIGIPYVWPNGFSEPPLVMIGLLAIAAAAAFVVGRRRRKRGWGTSSSA
ncbi:LPXTG cell wall anchor domain-containing protein [Roseomonas chloroacetimidivorans]|jgi:LPXTG-motif cell wall-anchored protein|uniref:LPXTG cell wall anchor domain-containing protein n=1 Tax=Roseomonas chloroacetimidivorans TaxID=1766656 RepID=UPI003C73630A